jgi:carbon-monoxide dehydrogenase iron sulfur subunit
VHGGVVNPRLGGIKIRQNLFENYEYQEICRHCPEPACLDACASGCIAKDPVTGVVTNDPFRCVGCWMCVMACPFDAVNRDVVNQVALKCDQCRGREVPACVAVCPTGALVFEVREDAPV